VKNLTGFSEETLLHGKLELIEAHNHGDNNV
jgi:hypothetical protein